MASWIKFELVGLKPKTKEWWVRGVTDNNILGTINWYSPWRKYCFYPWEHTIFEENCLRDIAEFIVRETKEHKAKK